MTEQREPNIAKATAEDIRFTVVPIECLESIKTDMQALSEQNELNEFQKQIIGERYILDPPQTDFDVKSVVIAVWQLSVAKAIFHYRGKTSSCIIDNSYTRTDVHDKLTQLFSAHGYSLKYFNWMPLKRLAVRSGLCAYGRNNITYCGDWGSFIRLAAYVSDAPAEDYVWREVKNLDACSTCGKCIASCPTGAILSNRFLIDNEKCLTYLNDSDRDIPDWVPKSAHHSLIECFRCQEVCPLNRKRLSNLETLEFNETETEAILNAATFQDFPESIRKKLWYYHTGDQFKCLPRNLQLMLDNLLGSED